MNQRELPSGIVVLEPEGYLYGVDDVSTELIQVVSDHLGAGRRFILIDCKDVPYANNNGLDMFRDLEVAGVTHQGKVVFSRVGKRTRTAMDMIKLTHIVEVFDTNEEGIAFLTNLIQEATEKT